jgi:phosphoglycolate phosphatase-like HAD superfamily hydrolase
MIRFLMWDLGGTLFDTYPAMTGAFYAALSDYGIQGSPPQIMNLCRQSRAICAATLAKRYRLDPKELRQHFEDHYRRVSLDEQKPFPGVQEVCRYILERDGSNFIITHRHRSSLYQLLEAHQMAALFADTLTEDDGYPRKPDPTVYRVLVERHRLPLPEILAVGDRNIDTLAAQAAGLKTCLFGVLLPNAPKPDITVTHYDDLLHWLQNTSFEE